MKRWIPGIVALLSTSFAFGDGAAQDFQRLGYSPSTLESYGAHVCSGERSGMRSTPSSSENNTANFKASSNEISANLKSQMLIDYAVGFARMYNTHVTAAEMEQAAVKSAHMTMPMNCDQKNSACDGLADLVRQLGRVGMSDADWCALFVETLANLTDKEARSGSSNVIHDGNGFNSANYASAYKLLARFDPNMPSDGKPKKLDAFLTPDKAPIPGCMAVYQSSKGQEGHMGLVISVSGAEAGSSGTMDTIEGNSRPEPGSSQRGVFLHSKRAWGPGSYIESQDANGSVERLYYKGCVLPWPDMAKFPAQSGCSAAVADPHLKPWNFPGFTQPGAPTLPAGAGGAEDFFKDWF